MVLGSLLGRGEKALSDLMQNPKFKPDEILYIGLQNLHDYQKAFLDAAGVKYTVQTEGFISDDEIKMFIGRFDHILVHLDIDVLDEHKLHDMFARMKLFSGK